MTTSTRQLYLKSNCEVIVGKLPQSEQDSIVKHTKNLSKMFQNLANVLNLLSLKKLSNQSPKSL